MRTQKRCELQARAREAAYVNMASGVARDQGERKDAGLCEAGVTEVGGGEGDWRGGGGRGGFLNLVREKCCTVGAHSRQGSEYRVVHVSLRSEGNIQLQAGNSRCVDGKGECVDRNRKMNE
jgi:hypothetical protein